MHDVAQISVRVKVFGELTRIPGFMMLAQLLNLEMGRIQQPGPAMVFMEPEEVIMCPSTNQIFVLTLLFLWLLFWYCYSQFRNIKFDCFNGGCHCVIEASKT
jgi:hypothetical protein